MNMINDEETNIEEIPSEEEDRDLSENKTFEIITYGADYTLSVLCEKMRNGEIITPDFQRKYVWKPKQASKLIESFLLGLPVPGVFLATDKATGNLLVVDGQQRLRTIEAFRTGKYPVNSENFYLIEVQEKWLNKTYKDLEPIDRKRFDDSILRASIIRQVDPKDNTSIYHIFERLNTGGTILQNQEVRNCVYFGKFNDLLHEINKDAHWRRIYNMDLPQKRMRDEELILRFFAIYFAYADYFKPMNSFLSKFMGDNRNPVQTKLDEMRKVFLDTIKYIESEVGMDAFRPKRNMNTAAFDSIMVTIAKYRAHLKPNPKDCIQKLFADAEYLNSITVGTTDPDSLNMRLELAKKYLVRP